MRTARRCAILKMALRSAIIIVLAVVNRIACLPIGGRICRCACRKALAEWPGLLFCLGVMVQVAQMCPLIFFMFDTDIGLFPVDSIPILVYNIITEKKRSD